MGNKLANKVAGLFVALTLLLLLVLGGIISAVTVATSCGATFTSQSQETLSVYEGVQSDTPDQFFEQFSEAEQAKRKENAAVIVRIGQERNFSEYSIAIAVATSIQESNLDNRPFNPRNNDHDSLGLFQQRPSQGWGNPEQIMDPVFAANTFYDRLQTIHDRDQRPMIDVAMQIQIPNKAAYERRWNWDEIALGIVREYYTGNGQVGDTCTAQNAEGWQAPLEPKTYCFRDMFGMRKDPLSGVWSPHRGIDLSCSGGNPIYAVHEGTIVDVGDRGQLGYYVEIDHGGGIKTGYAHMSLIAPQSKDDTFVRAGQVIGYVGTTGKSTGEHLHFVVYEEGVHIDPMPFLEGKGIELIDNGW